MVGSNTMPDRPCQACGCDVFDLVWSLSRDITSLRDERDRALDRVAELEARLSELDTAEGGVADR